MTELLTCPFCGGRALFEYVRQEGTMSSGMEPPTCYAGCKKCGIRFSGGETQGWDSTRRWYDRLEEAHDRAAEQWNNRHGAGDADRSAELTTAWMAGAESVLDRNAEDAARWRAWRELDEHAAADIAWCNAGAERDAAIDAARAGERG